MAKKYTAEEARYMILNSAASLFAKNGYENTSIQDIVSELDGLTKGAVYHHFPSKQAILNGIVRRFFIEETLLEEIALNKKLTGLKKIQHVLLKGMFNPSQQPLSVSAYELLNDPMFYSVYIRLMTETISPYLESFITEGNLDNSTHAVYPKQMAEVIILLISTWFIPSLYPNTTETFWEKLETTQYVLKQSGVDVMDKHVLSTILQKIKEKEAE